MKGFINGVVLVIGLVLGAIISTEGAVKKLNQSFEAGGVIQSAEFAGGSNVSTIVYLARPDALSQVSLFAVPITGGAPVDLSGNVVGGVLSFKVTSGGDQVVYLARKDNALVAELYSVPIGGGASVKLNGALTGSGNVVDFQLSRDGTQVVYRADQTTDEVFELFVVPVGGGAATQVNTPLVAGGDVTENYGFSPSGSNVVYVADQDTDDIMELYSVMLGVPGSLKISNFLAPMEDVLDFKFFPTTDRVVYRANHFGGAFRLWGVDVDGNNFTGAGITPTPVMGGNVASDYAVLSDGSQVVYISDQEVVGQNEIYIIPATGGIIFAKLNQPLAPGGDVSDFSIVNAKKAVVYRADQQSLNLKELFSSPLIDFTVDKVQKINPDIPADRSIVSFQITSNGEVAVYRSNQDSIGAIELYRVAFNGENFAKINPSLAAGGGVVDFRVSPDSSKVVYWADQDVVGTVELYIADLTSLSSDYDQDGKNDILIQSKKTLQLLTRKEGDAFQTVDFPTPLSGKQKVLASDDLDGDGKPEIVFGQGKSISIVTVQSDLQQQAAAVSAPVLSKGFKLTASGRIGANPIFVSSKGKKLEVLVNGQKVTGEVEKGNKVFGFEKVNGQPSILLNKGSAISALGLVAQSNQFILGTSLQLGNVTKGAKPSGVTALSSNTVEVITRKGKEVRAFTLPASGEGTVIFNAPKKVKVLGPR
ncbi:MAG: FG-GAP-like repeat-containing protein [Verrucomicrobiae bacterium]|nr:FG-GAP-like repeat-containing protein [Verrucomicrobiae bacterium]